MYFKGATHALASKSTAYDAICISSAISRYRTVHSAIYRYRTVRYLLCNTGNEQGMHEA